MHFRYKETYDQACRSDIKINKTFFFKSSGVRISFPSSAELSNENDFYQLLQSCSESPIRLKINRCKQSMIIVRIALDSMLVFKDSYRRKEQKSLRGSGQSIPEINKPRNEQLFDRRGSLIRQCLSDSITGPIHSDRFGLQKDINSKFTGDLWAGRLLYFSKDFSRLAGDCKTIKTLTGNLGLSS